MLSYGIVCLVHKKEEYCKKNIEDKCSTSMLGPSKIGFFSSFSCSTKSVVLVGV